MSPKSNNPVSPHVRPPTVAAQSSRRQQAQAANEKSARSNTSPESSARIRARKGSLVHNMQSILQRGKSLLTPSESTQSLHKSGFTTVKTAEALFPSVNPLVDGDDCLHDCASCTIDLPRKWSIDESDTLFGQVNGWESHLVVATGKTDWVRDITDEKNSVMEKVGQVSNKGKKMEYNGRQIMLSASDMPTGDDGHHDGIYAEGARTRCLVLPSWKFVEGVSTDDVEWMMREVVSKGSSNLTLTTRKEKVVDKLGTTTPDPDGANPDVATLQMRDSYGNETSAPLPSLSVEPPEGVNMRACPHRAVILMCSHKTRDWRCGASAPLLRKELERHLRPLGLYRDLYDDRPGGVGIYFINHVGGHKYSANVMIYRREGRKIEGGDSDTPQQTLSDEAVQGIWLARVRPEDCENIVKYTVLQGKLVKPQRQLRGGFDRESGLISW